MRKILFALLATAIFIAGCETTPRSHAYMRFSDHKASSSQYTTRAARIKLTEAATSISHSMQELSEIEQAQHPTAILPPPPDARLIGMAQHASVDWSGPVEPLAKRLAAASHYRLAILGRRPAIPAIVSINASDKPIADILRDVQFQVQKKARLVIYPAKHRLELRYRHG